MVLGADLSPFAMLSHLVSYLHTGQSHVAGGMLSLPQECCHSLSIPFDSHGELQYPGFTTTAPSPPKPLAEAPKLLLAHSSF
eukprot:1280449-Prymnesium_polylepis.2